MSEAYRGGRRDFLKRSAVVGGSLVWAAPLVQTLAKPAFAAGGSDSCVSTTCSDLTIGGLAFHISCGPQPGFEKCICVCANQAPPASCPDPVDPCAHLVCDPATFAPGACP